MTIDYPVELLEAFDPLDGQGVVIFVGSGPSCDAGLPTWADLLRRIAAEIGVDRDRDVEHHLSKGDLVAVAEFLKKQRSEKEIQERVARQIKRASTKPGLIHELIVSLPVAGIITTNYDLLLTMADKHSRFSTPSTPRTTGLRAKLREHFLLHLHGHVDDPETIVLTRESYDQIVLEGARVKQFLAAVFQGRVVLFIGFGFADTHIDSMLRDLKHDDEIGTSSVFALISSSLPSAPDRVQAANLHLRFVNPIYIMDPGDHGTAHLTYWLEGLRSAVDQIKNSHLNSVDRLQPTYLVEGLKRLLVSHDFTPLIADAISELPNRPDLAKLARMGLTRTEVEGLLARLGLNEMRFILIALNNRSPHPELEDALSCFPSQGTVDS